MIVRDKLIILGIVLGFCSGFWFIGKSRIELRKHLLLPSEEIQSAPTASAVLDQLPSLTLDEIEWGGTSPSVRLLENQWIAGIVRTGTLITNDFYLGHFESISALEKMGWQEASELTADGVADSAWGYKKIENDQQLFLHLSWRNESYRLTEDGQLEAQCPCHITLEVFLSEALPL